MTRSRNTGETAQPRRRGMALWGATAALAFAMLGPGAQAAAPKDAALSSEDKVCLDCHAKPGLAKTLGDGRKLSLVVQARAFAQSVHASSGCEGCHSDIDLKTHEKEPRSVASKRAFALEQMETCRDCHKKTVKQYDDSVHSALVRTGSDKAPLCSDCHDPHATRSAKEKAAGASEPVACQKCHEGIAIAYADSVHGRSGSEALACKDCHQTHSVKAAALGDFVKKECVSCHREVESTHATWLPNTARHLEAISCPACHTPGTTRRVNLRLYEGNTPHQAEKVGVPKFVKLVNWADGSASGLDARALWSLLQEFNSNGAEQKTVLRGRLEVQTGVQAHQLGERALALKDCDTCHRQGAASFQAVTVSMAGPDGRPLRHEASKGVLSSIESVGAVGGFYAIGSTRIKLLDQLLVLALAVGILIPTAHLTAKLLIRRRRAQQALAARATAPSQDGRAEGSGAGPDENRR
ncbi:MAG: cytochrome c3 family protein [Ramlibacter sp.]|nr:cytochrome c3 family protein [Ramlibacter sp.]